MNAFTSMNTLKRIVLDCNTYNSKVCSKEVSTELPPKRGHRPEFVIIRKAAYISTSLGFLHLQYS